jgi:hypothetical protein
VGKKRAVGRVRPLISLDWALKRVLRSKANFGVLEGFLTELLGNEVVILEVLESESNQEHQHDKFNRVDMKVRLGSSEIVIVEVQVKRERDFLQRMLDEQKGNLVILSGNNSRKADYILRSVQAGYNVLSDKPMVITPGDLEKLKQAFAEAQKRGVAPERLMFAPHIAHEEHLARHIPWQRKLFAAVNRAERGAKSIARQTGLG